MKDTQLKLAIAFITALACITAGCGGSSNILVAPLPRVTQVLFATGAAPNDIVLEDSGLIVANSLDNTVVKYGLNGAQLAVHSFPEFSSPSFLLANGGTVWTVCNGTNTLTGLNVTDLNPLPHALFQLDSGTMAFDGPASPTAVGNSIYLPRNRIKSFGPTTYDTGLLTRCNTDGSLYDIQTQGLNPGYAAFDAVRGLLYVVCTGNIQFDANFVPFAAGESLLEVYDLNNAESRIAVIPLGLTGAQRICLSPDGNTAYLGNALRGCVYKVNLLTREVERGLSNPIQLTPEFTYASDVQLTPDGRWLLVTSFNTDEMYVVDTASEEVNPTPFSGPLQLDGGNSLLSGAQRMAIGPAVVPGSSARVYVVMSIANCVAAVDLP